MVCGSTTVTPALVAGDHSAVELAGQLGQLDPVADPGHQGVVVDVVGVHDLPSARAMAMTPVM